MIDGATSMTRTAPVGQGPGAVAVNAATNSVYVANSGGNTVTVLVL
jgi:DNA-binding beta-propeller fold protein YncE